LECATLRFTASACISFGAFHLCLSLFVVCSTDTFLSTNKPRIALRYFTKLLYVEHALQLSSAATYLNLCNGLSRMGRHHRALEAANAALNSALGRPATAMSLEGAEPAPAESGGGDGSSGAAAPAAAAPVASGGGGESASFVVDPALVAAARHSVAVQLEHVGRRSEALTLYQSVQPITTKTTRISPSCSRASAGAVRSKDGLGCRA
jgi:hypothetical protein